MPILDYTLLVLLAACGLTAAMSRRLFGTAILLGTYSFILAILFAHWGGLDVSFTEAAVGSGVSTIFFIAMLWSTDSRVHRSKFSPRDFGLIALVAVLIIGGWIVLLQLPAWGDPTAMPHRHVSPSYLTQSYEATRTPNVVTAVLADYRSFDTLIETTVIFTAAMACWLLSIDREKPS